MLEVFTGMFTALFALFAVAAIAGHVLLAQALFRMVRGSSEPLLPRSSAEISLARRYSALQAAAWTSADIGSA